MAEAAPRFSVVIPAYNEAGYLEATLAALAAQDFPGPYEVIVVDNASTDATAAVAHRGGARVVYEAEPGVCAARQAGSAAARGEIVVSTDADTVAPRTWLSSIDRQMRSADVVGVAGPCRFDRPTWWSKAAPTLMFGLVQSVFALTGLVFYASATNIAMRRAAFPGYDRRLTQGGDELDLLRRLRARGRVVWDGGNVVTTSSRRLQRGLLYSLFVSLLFFYVYGYLVNRLSSRRRLGMAPAFREGVGRATPPASPYDRPSRTVRRWHRALLISLLAALAVGATAFANHEAVMVVTGFLGAP
ncbi:MAG: glycosyltransferase family 2 protein [Friedmanniella sp.]|nr:glycosyltransferase family 2 protein [Friedmanniella sp.]